MSLLFLLGLSPILSSIPSTGVMMISTAMQIEQQATDLYQTSP